MNALHVFLLLVSITSTRAIAEVWIKGEEAVLTFGPNQECEIRLENGGLVSSCEIDAPSLPSTTAAPIEQGYIYTDSLTQKDVYLIRFDWAELGVTDVPDKPTNGQVIETCESKGLKHVCAQSGTNLQNYPGCVEIGGAQKEFYPNGWFQYYHPTLEEDPTCAAAANEKYACRVWKGPPDSPPGPTYTISNDDPSYMPCGIWGDPSHDNIAGVGWCSNGMTLNNEGDDLGIGYAICV
jgi:hypothetical protein